MDGHAERTNWTDQLDGAALASSHLRRFSFQFVYCCSFRVRRKPCFILTNIFFHNLFKNMNDLVYIMIYTSYMKSLFIAFWECFLGFLKIITHEGKGPKSSPSLKSKLFNAFSKFFFTAVERPI